MERLHSLLLLLLIVSVLALLLALVWRADQHSREADATLACIERAQATATIALLAPSASVDAAGRVAAMKTLGAQIDSC